MLPQVGRADANFQGPHGFRGAGAATIENEERDLMLLPTSAYASCHQTVTHAYFAGLLAQRLMESVLASSLKYEERSTLGEASLNIDVTIRTERNQVLNGT
jgi:hypothetical protein